MWTTNDSLVGQTVTIYTGVYDERAVVIAVSPSSDNIKVRTADGDILTGNQWED